jgi:hypothetical protein
MASPQSGSWLLAEAKDENQAQPSVRFCSTATPIRICRLSRALEHPSLTGAMTSGGNPQPDKLFVRQFSVALSLGLIC